MEIEHLRDTYIDGHRSTFVDKIVFGMKEYQLVRRWVDSIVRAAT